VADNGVGIPGSEQKAIFRKFQRGSAAINGGSTGTGLGLAVVRAIVMAHSGKIDVRSEEHCGARFRIVLPRQHAEAA
jgi:signal transduction histidine kinase